ncbi:hypothetical protein GCM10010217_44100 [Streptomyces tubercidicus]
MVRARGRPQGISRRTACCWSAAAYAPGVRGALRSDASGCISRKQLRNGLGKRNRRGPGNGPGSPVSVDCLMADAAARGRSDLRGWRGRRAAVWCVGWLGDVCCLGRGAVCEAGVARGTLAPCHT